MGQWESRVGPRALARTQLNIDNVTDEIYYERIRNNATNGWATPGSARSAVLSLTWRL